MQAVQEILQAPCRLAAAAAAAFSNEAKVLGEVKASLEGYLNASR